jgi:hypothetical protein
MTIRMGFLSVVCALSIGLAPNAESKIRMDDFIENVFIMYIFLHQ